MRSFSAVTDAHGACHSGRTGKADGIIELIKEFRPLHPTLDDLPESLNHLQRQEATARTLISSSGSSEENSKQHSAHHLLRAQLLLQLPDPQQDLQQDSSMHKTHSPETPLEAARTFSAPTYVHLAPRTQAGAAIRRHPAMTDNFSSRPQGVIRSWQGFPAFLGDLRAPKAKATCCGGLS